MNRLLERVSVLDCASPLALWKSWAVESARGLAQSKTLRRYERFMESNPVRPAAQRVQAPFMKCKLHSGPRLLLQIAYRSRRLPDSHSRKCRGKPLEIVGQRDWHADS